MLFYSVTVFIVCFFMLTQILTLMDNQTLKRKERKYLIVIAVLICIGATCEFLGKYLDGMPVEMYYIHGAVKIIEFSIAPIVPILYCVVVDFSYNDNRARDYILSCLIVSNIALQVINFFFPFMWYIDSKNVYMHGSFYWIYRSIYLMGIAYFIFIFMKSTRKYQNKNIRSLIAIIFFTLFSYGIRLICLEIRTEWLVASMTLSVFINYYADMSLRIDALTLLLNRRSYEYQLKNIEFSTAIIRLDINKFKEINDTYGHRCGDKCLQIIASTILSAYGKYGYCYRTGGDEFDVILKQGVLEEISNAEGNFDTYAAIERLNKNFDNLLAQKYDTYPMLSKGVSQGFGIYYGMYDSDNMSMKDKRFSSGLLKEAIEIADKHMYEHKNQISETANTEE